MFLNVLESSEVARGNRQAQYNGRVLTISCSPASTASTRLSEDDDTTHWMREAKGDPPEQKYTSD
jgi:hypothetical protein